VTRGRAAVASVVGAVSIGLALAVGGCSKSPTPGGPTTTESNERLPFAGSPTADELADIAGLGFPDSMTGYRSARVGPAELDVTFQLPVADVHHFLDASQLGDLAPGRRSIVHPSPLWDLDPGPGTMVASAQSEVDGLVRRVEVVTADTSTTGGDGGSDGGGGGGGPSGLATVRLIVAAV
jgi:hypothetical protein